MRQIPQDPYICISFINTQLRDFYPNLAALCEDFQIDEQELTHKLNEIGYFYNMEQNQFR